MLQRSIKLLSLLSIGFLSLNQTAIADTIRHQPGNYIDLGPKFDSIYQPTSDSSTSSVFQPDSDFFTRPSSRTNFNLEIPTSPSSIPADLDSVFELPLRLEIQRGKRQVVVYRGNTVVKKYPIAVGKPGWETPIGTYKVRQKIKNPTWIHPLEKGVVIPGGDPENPLGRYWIGFWTDGKNWIGFHGTPNPKSVGRPASHGCVRMYNKDVEELFQQVRLGTVVTVVK